MRSTDWPCRAQSHSNSVERGLLLVFGLRRTNPAHLHPKAIETVAFQTNGAFKDGNWCQVVCVVIRLVRRYELRHV